MGSIAGSEITAAALDLKVGLVRRDPFAMLPFCGYHMGDYFAHWIKMGGRTPVSSQPRFFFVNWFRKTKEGRWLWPGYGENSRVLKWIFERCDGTGDAIETSIGLMPAPNAIERPAGVTAEDMKKLLEVDVSGWKAELKDIKTEHYPKFGDRLPKELRDQLEALNNRLG
jgi:phosphoenolpyruvate carboxykinase (GTP)